jgi:hypothetical protein
MAGALRCPYCRRRLFSVVADHLPVSSGLPPHSQLFAFGCPSCQRVIDVQPVLGPAKAHSLASLHDGSEAKAGPFARLRRLASKQQASGIGQHGARR